MSERPISSDEVVRAVTEAYDAARTRPASGVKPFDLHFQPIRDPHNKIVGTEALVRLLQGEDLVLPLQWLPVVERDTRLMEQLTYIVLNEALRQRKAEGWGFGISVNVPVDVLEAGVFPGQVAALLERYGLRGDRLMIEVTERVGITDAAAFLASARALRALGVRVAVDNYPTLKSGEIFDTLHAAGLVNELHISRNVVAGKDELSPQARDAIALGKRHGLTVVVEGIETPEIAAQVAQLGCRAQGFLVTLGRPGPVEVLRAMLTVAWTAVYVTAAAVAAGLVARRHDSAGSRPSIARSDPTGPPVDRNLPGAASRAGWLRHGSSGQKRSATAERSR